MIKAVHNMDSTVVRGLCCAGRDKEIKCMAGLDQAQVERAWMACYNLAAQCARVAPVAQLGQSEALLKPRFRVRIAAGAQKPSPVGRVFSMERPCAVMCLVGRA